jgi:hypothetical protein
MTNFRRRVLQGVAQNEYSGPLAVVSDITGCDPIDVLNVDKAIAWLEREGYIEIRDFTLTDKGREFLG